VFGQQRNVVEASAPARARSVGGSVPVAASNALTQP
jgi:hypothetical protein